MSIADRPFRAARGMLPLFALLALLLAHWPAAAAPLSAGPPAVTIYVGEG